MKEELIELQAANINASRNDIVVMLDHFKKHAHDVEEPLAQINERISTIQGGLMELETLIKDDISNVHENMSKIHEGMSKLRDELSGIHKALEVYSGKIGGLEIAIQTLKNSLWELPSRITFPAVVENFERKFKRQHEVIGIIGFLFVAALLWIIFR